MKERCQACRPEGKLQHDSELYEQVTEMLRNGYSPEQIAGNLRRMFPTHKSNVVSHETIYNAIYALPVGELRKELIHCLRHGKTLVSHGLAAWIGVTKYPIWSAFTYVRQR